MYKLKGLYDSHLHVLGLGFNMNNIDLSTLQSISELKELSISEGKEVIFGRGWHEENFIEKRVPHKSELNNISKEQPVIFLRVCGHVLVCNDKALELAGITSDTPQIEGGLFDYNTGMFTEDALSLIYKIIPKYKKEDIKEVYIKSKESQA